MAVPEPVRLFTNVLDGKNIAYCSETVFEVQVSKGRGSYKTRYEIKGDLARAVMHYNCINIGHNYNKRLLMRASKKPVLARQKSA